MLFCIWVILIVLDMFFAYIKRESKILILLNLLFIWVLMSGYSRGIDIGNYRNDYITVAFRNYASVFTDPGYSLLVKICALQGLSFFQFKKIVSAIFISILFVGIYRLKVNNMYVLGCYLMYQVVMDSIQYRNFLGMALVVLGFSFLQRNDLKGKMIYGVFIVFASTFHTVMIVYLLYLLKDNKWIKKYYKKLLIVLVLLISIMTYLNNRRIPFIENVITLFLRGDTLNIGYLQTDSSIAFLLPLLSLIMYITLLYIYKKRKKVWILDWVYSIDIISLLFIPFCIMSFQWYRIIRNMNILNYCAIQKECSHLRSEKQRINIYACSILIIVFWMYCDFYRFIGLEGTKTIFMNNFFLGIN